MIELTNPKTLCEPAKFLDWTGIHFFKTSMNVNLVWYEADGTTVIKSDSITISGQDYTDVVTENVVAGDVGKNASSVLLLVIKRKIKAMRTLTGTVS